MGLLNKMLGKNNSYESQLLKKYGRSNKLKKYGLKILFIADTHNCLNSNSEVLQYIKNQLDYNYCILLGDHSGNDLAEILKVVPHDKICGILGNHDSWQKYEQYEINNINGKVLNINGVRIAGIGGSYKYKNSIEYALYTHE